MVLALCVSIGTGIAVPVVAKDAEPKEVNVSNSYLSLDVGTGQNALYRFRLYCKDGDMNTLNDDNKNIMYDNFYSSYTTIFLNNRSYRFGEGDNSNINIENNTIKAVQTFDDSIEVTQTLGFADGMDTGHCDMLHISYHVKNLRSEPMDVGIRILLDIQEDEQDTCAVYVNDDICDKEKAFVNAVPDLWTAQTENVRTFGKQDTTADTMIVGNWDKLFNDKTITYLNTSDNIDDTAVAYIWDKESLESEKDYAIYYGVKNIREIEESSQESSEESSQESSEESIQESSEESSQESSEESSQESSEESSQESSEESSRNISGEISQSSPEESSRESANTNIEYDNFEINRGNSVGTGENQLLKWILITISITSGVYVLISLIKHIIKKGKGYGRYE